MDVDRLLDLSRANNTATNETAVSADNDRATDSNGDVTDNSVTADDSAAREPAGATGRDQSKDFAMEADCKPGAIVDRDGMGQRRASSGVHLSSAIKAIGPKRPWVDAACIGREISIVLVALVVSIAVVSVMRPHPAATETAPPATVGFYYVPKRAVTTPTPSPSPEPCWCRFADSDEGMTEGQLIGPDCVCRNAADSAHRSLDATNQTTSGVKSMLAFMAFLLALAFLMEVSGCNPL